MTTDLELNFGTPIPKAEAGTYPAILVGIEPFVIQENTPEAKTLIRWEFSLDGIEDPETPGMTLILDGVTSTATGPRSKMRPWVTALLGRNLEEALSLSALRSQLLGHPCLVVVEINEAGYSKVAGVIPPPRQSAKPPTPTPAAPASLPGERLAAAEPGEFDGAPTQPPVNDTAGNLPF